MMMDAEKKERLENVLVYVVIFGIIIGGMFISSALHKDDYKGIKSDDKTGDYSEIILTVEEAEGYIGKTVAELCRAYGKTVNIHINASGEHLGINPINCSEDIGRGLMFDDFIVTQAYYYYDEESEAEYKKNQELCRAKDSWCDDAPSVYIDSLPADEAKALGITPR